MSEVRDRLLEAKTPEARLHLLERLLLQIGRDRIEPDPALAYAVNRITHQPEDVLVKSLAAEIGYSHRQLIRKFDEKVGLKPKGLARVFRFNRVLGSVNPQGATHWASIASDCGYFDQAHLYHDFQELAGMTPSQYLIDRQEYDHFIPIR